MTSKKSRKRAKKVGFTDRQIEQFANDDILNATCDSVSPQTNPDARPKRGIVPEKKDRPDDMPDQFDFVSELECRQSTTNRAQFDRDNLNAELRRINRRYGSYEPTAIERDASKTPIDGKDKHGRDAKLLVTKYTIYYK